MWSAPATTKVRRFGANNANKQTVFTAFAAVLSVSAAVCKDVSTLPVSWSSDFKRDSNRQTDCRLETDAVIRHHP